MTMAEYIHNEAKDLAQEIIDEITPELKREYTQALINQLTQGQDSLSAEEYARQQYTKRATELISEHINKERTLNLLHLLERLGDIPDELLKKIQSQKDSDILKKWFKLALTASSIEDFSQKIKNI